MENNKMQQEQHQQYVYNKIAKSIKNDGKIIPNSLKCNSYNRTYTIFITSFSAVGMHYYSKFTCVGVSKQQKNLYGLRTQDVIF